MNGLHLGLFSVVCITLLARWRTTAFSEHDVVCEGSVMKLKCLNKSFAITIQSAIYGRNLPGNVLCPKPENMPSSLSDELTCKQDVFSKVNKLCEGKMSCDISATKSTFEEPCPNVYKYLDVAYKCEDVLNRPIRQLVVPVNISQTPTAIFPTSTKLARMSVSTVQLKPTPTLAHKIEQLNTVYKQLSSISSSTFSPTSQPGATSSSYSVSVSRVSQGEFTRTDITKLRSTLLISLPPSKPAPKTTEKITTHQTHVIKEKQAAMKLFHFILSFHVVRQEKLEKHTANSIVCFLLGLLLGLLFMMAVFVFYHLRRSRRKRQGRPDKAAYSKHKMLNGDVDEKVELNSKQMEALEMESQFGETV